MWRKRPLTLIETLISFALTSVLVVAAFSILRGVDHVTRKQEQFSHDLVRYDLVRHRLEAIFQSPMKGNAEDNTFLCYTEGKEDVVGDSLVLSYQNDGSRFPPFAHVVVSRLYLDREGNLSLVTWPYGKHKTADIMRKEVLQTGVAEIDFHFYVEPPPPGLPVDPPEQAAAGEKRDPHPKDAWHTTWLEAYERLPAMVGITLTYRETERKEWYIFPLAEKGVHPFYPKEVTA